MPDFLLQDGQTMLYIGDSITDCGRRAAEAPLGGGYVRLFTEMATASHPDRAIRHINKRNRRKPDNTSQGTVE